MGILNRLLRVPPTSKNDPKRPKTLENRLKTFQTVRKHPKCPERQKRSKYFPAAAAAAHLCRSHLLHGEAASLSDEAAAKSERTKRQTKKQKSEIY